MDGRSVKERRWAPVEGGPTAAELIVGKETEGPSNRKATLRKGRPDDTAN